MKKTVYLHIGAPKTGTTSIQKFIHDHAEELARNDYFVPPGQHAELPLSLLAEQHQKLVLDWPTFWPFVNNESEQVWAEVIDQFNRSGCSKCIISAENFSELVDCINPDGSDPYGERLRSLLSGFEIRVVVYLRSISAYVQSMYKERVKNSSEIRSCENLLCSWKKAGSSYFYPSKYLDYFTGLFGRETLLIRKYSRSEFPHGDVVWDFLEAINYPFPGIAQGATLHENMSLPDEGVILKRLFNVVGIQDTSLNQTISRYLIRSHSVTTPGGPRRECSFATLERDIEAEAGRILDKYALDIRDENGIRNLDAMPAESGEAFLISLLAHVIAQNENILSRLGSLEDSLNELRSNRDRS